jgi:hypothetical protein
MARAFFCNNKTLVFQVTNYAFDGAVLAPLRRSLYKIYFMFKFVAKLANK